MVPVDRLRLPTCFVVFGLLAVSGGCSRRPGEVESQKTPEYVETIGFAQGLKAHFSSKRTAPEFTNDTQYDLTDIDLKITFTPRDPSAKEREESVRWEVWRKGEKRTPEVSVEKNTYSKVRAKGTAKRDGKPVKLSFGVDLL